MRTFLNFTVVLIFRLLAALAVRAGIAPAVKGWLGRHWDIRDLFVPRFDFRRARDKAYAFSAGPDGYQWITFGVFSFFPRKSHGAPGLSVRFKVVQIDENFRLVAAAFAREIQLA